MPIIVLSFIVLLQGAAFAAVPSGWQVGEGPGMKAFWTHQTIAGSSIGVVEENDEYNLTAFKEDVYVRELADVRSFLHNLMGIEKWAIEKHEISRTANALTLTIQGSYLRGGEIPVRFCERHEFTATRFQQTQLIAPTASFEKLAPQGCVAMLQEVKL
jgi:hypothetical protein